MSPISAIRDPQSVIRNATWIGLFLSLFAMLLVRQTVSYFSPTLTFIAAIWKESFIWASAAALLVVIRRGESLPLTSIGIGTSRWWKSILFGLITAVICAGVSGALAALTGYGHGPGSAAFEKLPLWLITLIVFRAGVVEEFFYRGYPIERLQALGLNRYWAAAIPLVIFALGHHICIFLTRCAPGLTRRKRASHLPSSRPFTRYMLDLMHRKRAYDR